MQGGVDSNILLVVVVVVVDDDDDDDDGGGDVVGDYGVPLTFARASCCCYRRRL